MGAPMEESTSKKVLVGVSAVAVLIVLGMGAWIAVLMNDQRPLQERMECAERKVDSSLSEVARLKEECESLRGKLAQAENRAVEAESQVNGFVYAPVSDMIRTGDELIGILKKLNEPLTDLQKDLWQKNLVGFLKDHDGKPVVLRGHVSRVGERLFGAKFSLYIELMEGLSVRFLAQEEQKGVLEDMNTGYEVAVLGRIDDGWMRRLKDKLNPGCSVTMTFVKSIGLDVYERAAKYRGNKSN